MDRLIIGEMRERLREIGISDAGPRNVLRNILSNDAQEEAESE